MLFAAKTKGYFVEQNDHSMLLARTSTWASPLVIEELCECPVGDAAALTEALRRVQPKKTPSGYLNANCGVYPPRRLVRCATLEPKRMKEAGYFTEILTTNFRLEPDKYTIYVLNAPDGTDLDPNKTLQKEALFCGMLNDDVITVQDGLLAAGIYPERLELGSVGMLGGIIDYLKFSKSDAPTLVLEIGPETTHSFILASTGLQASRPIAQGLESMLPVVQKELGLKDAESARKLFFSNTFDFTGMGPLLVKRLLKELQSSIGFYEVQTGQSVGQILCLGLPPKLAWLEGAIAGALGIGTLKLEIEPWLQAHGVTLAAPVAAQRLDARWFGLLSLMISHVPSHAAVPEKKA